MQFNGKNLDGLALGLAGSALALVVFLYGMNWALSPESTAEETPPRENGDPIEISFLQMEGHEILQSPWCEQTKARIEDLLVESRSCSVDNDCTISTLTLCPIGCFRAVNRNAVQELEFWMTQYGKRRCSNCVYMCDVLNDTAHAECIKGRCELRNPQPGTGAYEAALRAQSEVPYRVPTPIYEKPEPPGDL